jgi:hypothetical protein
MLDTSAEVLVCRIKGYREKDGSQISVALPGRPGPKPSNFRPGRNPGYGFNGIGLTAPSSYFRVFAGVISQAAIDHKGI